LQTHGFGFAWPQSVSSLGHELMPRNFRDSVSFAVMAALIFVLATLLNSDVSSPNRVDSVWSFYWINLYRHLDARVNAGFSYSFVGLRVNALVGMVAFSISLTWILSRVLQWRRRHEFKPESSPSDNVPVGRNILLLAPAAISAFAGLFLFHGLPFGLGQHHLLILGGFGLGRHLILILGGVCCVTFF